MPGPTPPGARVGSWKYQAGHTFSRGQPVYLSAPGVYALATIATGSDGIVGDVATTRFELVSAGELDRLIGLTPGATYSLSTTPGQVVQGSANPLYKAMSAEAATLTSAVQVAFVPPTEPEEPGDGELDPRYALVDHLHDDKYIRSIDHGAVISIYNLNAGPVFDAADGRQVLTG